MAVIEVGQGSQVRCKCMPGHQHLEAGEYDLGSSYRELKKTSITQYHTWCVFVTSKLCLLKSITTPVANTTGPEMVITCANSFP